MPRFVPSRLAAALLVAAPLLSACGESKQATPAAPPPPTVTVAKPVTQNVVDHDEYVGRFVAVDSVEVRARVSGYLEKVNFKDGQIVKQGDLLFTIDKRTFQNTLDQARANLSQAQGNLAFADSDLKRAQQLVRDKTVTEQVFEQRQQAKRGAEAAVAANQAQVRQAELDLEFTELRAPVAGRIGDRRVSPGNLVTGGFAGGTSLLATIVSLDPIRLEFTADEQAYLRYERIFGGGKDLDTKGASTPVKLKLIDEPDFTHEGKIDFIDNVIDRASGTIRGRAVFANPKGLFTPGMFARVQVPASPPADALLVPDVAVGTEQVRKFVYVVGPDNTVSQKYIEMGQLVGKAMRVVKSGITAEDRVIVNGLMRVRPGAKVTPQEQGATPPAPPAGPQAKTN